MIEVKRLNGETIYVSPHQVEVIEENPDTVLVMLSGRKIIVKNSVEEVKEQLMAYWKEIGPQAAIVKETQNNEGS